MSAHNHDMNERKIESKQLRVMAKRKVSDDISARPSKVIRQELQKLDESNLQTKALKNVALAVYRERRRELPVCAMIYQTYLWMEHLSIARSSFTNFTPSMEAKMDIMFRWYLLVCRQKQSYATEIYGQRYRTCALQEIFTLTPRPFMLTLSQLCTTL